MQPRYNAGLATARPEIMASTKRARRHARESSRLTEGCTRWQLLVFGALLFGPDGQRVRQRARNGAGVASTSRRIDGSQP